MNTEIKRKWVAALRGGKFEQGRCALRDRDNKCSCLGVLCDLIAGQDWGEPNSDGRHFHRGEGLFPDISVLEKAELTIQEAQRLARLNDVDRRTFRQIARHIERAL